MQDLKVQIAAAFARGNTVFCPMDQRGFLGRGDVGSHLVWAGKSVAQWAKYLAQICLVLIIVLRPVC